jgi:hypothetical protein
LKTYKIIHRTALAEVRFDSLVSLATEIDRLADEGDQVYLSDLRTGSGKKLGCRAEEELLVIMS